MSGKLLCRLLKCYSQNARYFCSKPERSVSSAGIVVIGDEILNGDVADSNSNFLAMQLHKFGVKLRKISTISDDVAEIRDEVREFSQKYDYVLTTGGIGPTHDDVTYEGVALAFNEPLYLHPDLQEICCKFYNTTDLTHVGMKLAYIPKSSRLHYDTISGTKLTYPNVSVRNVFMFPGIPELLKKTVIEVGPILWKTNNRFHSKCFYCNLPEHQIVMELQQVVDEFPDVRFGCYPKLHHRIYKVKVTVESDSAETTLKAYARLMELIPQNSIVDFDDL